MKIISKTGSLFILLLISLMPFCASSMSPSVKSTLFNHLYTVNKQWVNYQDYAPEVTVSFNSDLDRIQKHLYLVCDYLRVHSADDLTENQLNNRTHLINILREYADNRVFPTNKYHKVRTPYFVDDNNVHCAVGYLMAMSGSTDLVDKIRAKYNYNYIEDIKVEGIQEWADEHGFSLNELKWIQPGYPPTTQIEPLLGGTNGTVRKVVKNNSNNEVFVIGNFDTLDALPCLNVGMYANNQLSCLGTGLSGVIRDIGYSYSMDRVIAFGDIEHNGQTFPIAAFDGAVWEYYEIPAREGATGSTGILGGNFMIEAVINHPTIGDDSEVWKFDGTTWERISRMNGPVNDCEVSSVGRVFAGHFDTITVFNSSNVPIDTILTNNVAFRANNSITNWNGVDQPFISDTVWAIESVGFGTVYFGGSASSDPSSSGVCVSRYLNGALQPVVMSNNFDGTHADVFGLRYKYGENQLLLVGNFEYTPGIGEYGKNLVQYDIGYNSLNAMAFMDSTAYSIEQLGNDYYIGGAFTSQFSTALNHLAYFSETVSIQELASSEIVLSPMPFIDHVKIEELESDCDFEIINSLGQTVLSGTTEGKSIQHLDQLPNGTYVLRLMREGEISAHRMMK